MQNHTCFPNKTGDHPETDDLLTKELHDAGIQTILDLEPDFSEQIKTALRQRSKELKTCIAGHLYGWIFTRNWYYWIAKGPGIEISIAEELNKQYGQIIRVDGFAGGLDPRKRFHGLAVGHYHVDTAEGLKVLADTIKKIVEYNEKILQFKVACKDVERKLL